MIDFKGCKYALQDINGVVMQFNEDPVIEVEGFGVSSELYFLDVWSLHTNPDYKESKEMIYTQEMYDNKEVPKVGMKVSLVINEMSDTVTGELLALTKQYIILKVGEEMEQHFHRGKWVFKPVDPRTDEEKAIDDLVLQINKTQFDANMGDMSTKEIISTAFKAGVTFTESK